MARSARRRCRSRTPRRATGSYFIPIGILIRQFAPPEFWTSIHHVPADYPALDWTGFVSNLIPVTLGNIVGGAVLVAGIYWLIYLRKESRAPGRV